MKVILITIAFVCAYAVCMINLPSITHAFDKRWDCTTPLACIKKR